MNHEFGDPRLVVRLPDGEETFALTADDYVLGRDTSSDIVVPLPFVSRLHARLVREGSGYRYIHLGRNPTLLNGEPVQERVLRHADCLCIGPADQQIQLVYEQAPRDPISLSRLPTLTATLALDRAQGETITIGRDPLSSVVLDSPTVSRRHARLVLRGGQAELEDLRSTNGTFVNGRRIERRHLAKGDVVRIGPYKLLYREGELLQYDEGYYARLEAYHLSVKIGGALILDDLSVCASPGEITAVAGISGAGKSTLLRVLSGLTPPTRGRVVVNDSDLYSNFDALRCLIGYVPQADIVHEELPLERALYYAARLRLPLDVPITRIREQVSQVLAVLDLTGQRWLAIRKMSGGQRKRASIAVELLAKPPLLFLDEPTSGLDPALRRQLMEVLRDLAREGKTVVLATHDPDSLAHCDQIIFLAPGGKLAFLGRPRDALRYFDVPDYVDLYRRVEGDKNPEAWRQRFLLSTYFRDYAARHLPGLDTEEPDSSGTKPPEQTSNQGVGSAQAMPFREGLARFLFLALRYCEVRLRDIRNLALLLLQAPILAFLLALVSTPDALTDSTNPADARKLLLLLAISATWLGTINASREIVKELPIYIRERMMGIGPVPYVLSKMAVLSLVCFVQSWLLLTVVGLRVELPEQGVMLPGRAEMCLSLVLTSLAALSMGLLISATSSAQERAMSVVPLVLVPQIVFAGVIFELGGVAEVISFLSIAKWSVQLLGATAHLPGGDYAPNAAHQLSRWLILLSIGGGFILTAIWLVNARKAPS